MIPDVLVKTVPFPVPQAIQEEAKHQLGMLVMAGITGRSILKGHVQCLVKLKPIFPIGNLKFRMTLDLRLLNLMIQS